MEPGLPVLGAQSPSHWTTGEVPVTDIFLSSYLFPISFPELYVSYIDYPVYCCFFSIYNRNWFIVNTQLATDGTNLQSNQ